MEMDETLLHVKSLDLDHGLIDQNAILHEYEATVSNLKEELHNCKLEQSKLRSEIENIRKENHEANTAMQSSLAAECDLEKCNCVAHNEEALTNLEKRITILQMEKDSVFQLWQMALKAIDVLEEELKTVHKEDKSTKFYQDQINNIKETYSEAIKLLETKLVAAKESFFQQQALSEKTKEKIDQVIKEKNDIIQQLNIYHQQEQEKDKLHQVTIDSLKDNINFFKNELEQMKQSKKELEERLKSSEAFANSLLVKDHEAKSKVLEAVNLVESALKEKDLILQREARLSEEKVRLESTLGKLTEDYTNRLEKEVNSVKETYTKTMKKYLLEIKELKAELRDKVTLLDRSQREYKLMEEELNRVRQGSDSLLQKSCVKMSSLEQTLHKKQYISDTSKENYIKSIYNDRINFLEQQIGHLEEKLSATCDKLRRVHMQSSRDVEDHVREADDRTREIMEKCLHFERQLSRALMDKENLTTNLHSLEISFEKEMQRRNQEKLLLENKVKNLQQKIISAETIVNEPRMYIDSSKKNTSQQTLMECDSMVNLLALQDKYDKKTKELTQHVETHQKLSNKWKEEANLLTNKFQKRSQELKTKISILQKQNDELTRELLFYQQLLARCNTQLLQNYNKEGEIR